MLCYLVGLEGAKIVLDLHQRHWKQTPSWTCWLLRGLCKDILWKSAPSSSRTSSPTKTPTSTLPIQQHVSSRTNGNGKSAILKGSAMRYTVVSPRQVVYLIWISSTQMRSVRCLLRSMLKDGTSRKVKTWPTARYNTYLGVRRFPMEQDHTREATARVARDHIRWLYRPLLLHPRWHPSIPTGR